MSQTPKFTITIPSAIRKSPDEISVKATPSFCTCISVFPFQKLRFAAMLRQRDVVATASRGGISLKLGEILQIMMLMSFCSSLEKSEPACSGWLISLKIERGHGKSQARRLIYSDSRRRSELREK
jgi:hypothetical protein